VRHDGSLSDTQTYAEVKPEYSSYAMWLKHSNTAGSRLSDGESVEQLQIGSPAMTRHGHKMIHQRSGAPGQMAGQMSGNESPYVQSPRMNRSNSIRLVSFLRLYLYSFPSCMYVPIFISIFLSSLCKYGYPWKATWKNGHIQGDHRVSAQYFCISSGKLFLTFIFCHHTCHKQCASVLSLFVSIFHFTCCMIIIYEQHMFGE